MDQWVDNQLASLAPAPNWEPRAAQALEALRRRKSATGGQRWVRFGMTATILATTAVVLVMLPWQKMWTPKGTPPAPKAAVAVIAKQQAEPAKPAEKTTEAPAKQETQTPPAEQPKAQINHLLDLPDNEDDLLAYLQELAAKRQQTGQTQFDKLQQFYDVQRTAAQAPPPANATQPMLIKQVTPEYSDDARKARVKGTIEIVVTINTDGTVQFERFVNTLGYGLDEKAREAVEKWQFRPAMKDGVPVPTMISVNVNFSLR